MFKPSKNFVITGVSGYLGQEIARYLSEDQGCNVLGISRSKPDLKISGAFENLSGIDLLKPSSLKKMQSETKKAFQDSFNIVNAVGYFYAYETLLDTPLDEAKKIMDGSFTTVYNTAHTLLPLQIQNGGGHFISFSCCSTIYNYPKMTPFVASKSAINALVKQIANEYGDKNIISNAFLLTTLKTDTEKNMKPNGDYENWLELSEVAQKVHWLSQNPPFVQGNLIKLYKHSKSFFGQAQSERIAGIEH